MQISKYTLYLDFFTSMKTEELIQNIQKKWEFQMKSADIELIAELHKSSGWASWATKLS